MASTLKRCARGCCPRWLCAAWSRRRPAPPRSSSSARRRAGRSAAKAFRCAATSNIWAEPVQERIAIVGAGLIGRAWAIVFARAGCQVRLHDAGPQALADCQRLLLENIGDLAGHGLITEA